MEEDTQYDNEIEEHLVEEEEKISEEEKGL